MEEGTKRKRRPDYIKVAKTQPHGRPRNCTNCKLPKTFCTCGRPTKLNAETLLKLQEAYSLGCDHEQAAFHAEIDIRTLHRWREENPPLATLIDHWRERPNMRAFNRVFASMLTDTGSAWRWLERNMPKRFAPMQKHAGEDGGPLNIDVTVKEALDRAYGKGKPDQPANGV